MPDSYPATNIEEDLTAPTGDGTTVAHRRPFRRYILLSLVGIAAIAVLVSRVDVDAIGHELSAADLGYVLIAAGALAAFYAARAARWHLILGRRHPFPFVFWTSSLGYLANNAAPGLGELARPWLLRTQRGVPFASGVSTVMLERLLDLWGLAAIGLLSFAALGVQGTSVDVWLWAVGMGVAAVTTALLASTFALARRRESVTSWCERMLERVPFPAAVSARISSAIDSLLSGAAVLKSDLRTQALLFSGTLAVWALNAVTAYFAFRAVGLEPEAAVLSGGLMVVAVSQGLPAPPGYIGTYQAVWLAAYSALGLGPDEKVLAAAVVSHGLILILTTAFGLIGLQATLISLRELFTLRRRPAPAFVAAGLPVEERS